MNGSTHGIALVALALCLGACASEEKAPERRMEPIEPASIDGLTNAVRIGDVVLAEQPSPAVLSDLRHSGFGTVINLRPDAEMTFQESVLVGATGLTYVSIPLTPTDAGPKEINRFLEAVRAAHERKEQIFIHCSSGNRAAALWATYEITDLKVPPELAVQRARQAGMKSPELVGLIGQYARSIGSY